MSQAVMNNLGDNEWIIYLNKGGGCDGRSSVASIT